MFWKALLLILALYGVKQGYEYVADYKASGQLETVAYGQKLHPEKDVKMKAIRQYYESQDELEYKPGPTPESRKRPAGRNCSSYYNSGSEYDEKFLNADAYVSGKPGRKDDYLRIESMESKNCMVEFSLDKINAGKLLRQK